MSTKYYVEKEINVDKLSSKEKENYKDEKSEKSEKDAVKEHKDTKEQKDKDTKEHKDKEKDTKEHKDHREKPHKDTELQDVTTAATAQYKAHEKFIQEKQTGVDKLPHLEGKYHKEYKPEVEGVGIGVKELFKAPTTEIKEFKHEIKEHKLEVKEYKHEVKEFKIEKIEYERYPVGPVEPGDPVEAGSVGERLAALEAAMTQLMHFIPTELRPDLTQGALKQEPDTAAKEAAPKATEHKPKS